MNTAFKIIALMLVCSVLAVVIKQKNSEYAFLLSLSAAVAVLVYIISEIFPAAKRVSEVFVNGGGNSVYIKTALKATAVGFLCEISADVCRDYGQSALGKMAETGGKCVIFILCIPPFCSLLDVALEFLKL